MKTFRSISFFFVLALASSFFLTACKDAVGLGGAVDITPPVIRSETIYPPVNAVVRDSFLLSVAVEDDRKVQSVSALLTCREEGAEYSHQFILEQHGNVWQTYIDRKNSHPKYRPVDGTYTVRITAKDGSGKEVDAETPLVIDNTPPLLVLQRPSTAVMGQAAPDGADIFGDVFFLAGQVYDTCPVDSLVMRAQAAGGGKPETCTLNNIPQTIRMTVDMFSAAKPGFYKSLYGTEERGGNKAFLYGITVTDSARLYQDITQRNGSGAGNSTDRYYLYEDVYKEVLSKYKIDKVYKMTREAGQPTGRAVGTADAAEVSAVLQKLKQVAIRTGGERTGVFALNPSINPKYGIEGHTPASLTDLKENGFGEIYEDSTINVKLSPNFDEDPLKEADTYEFYIIDLEEYKAAAGTYDVDVNSDEQLYADKAHTTLKAGIIKIEKDHIIKTSKSGSSHIMSIKLPQLRYITNYILQVRGSDQKDAGHTLIADPKGSAGRLYGFKVKKNGKIPEVQVKQVNNRHADNGRFYVKKGDTVGFTVEVSSSAVGTVRCNLSGGGLLTALHQEKAYTVSSGAKADFSFGHEHFIQDKSAAYKLTISAEDNEGKGSSRLEEYQIYYDVEGPVITANAPTLVTVMPVIAGDIYDAGAGVKYDTIKASYKYGTEAAKNIDFATPAAADNNNWKLQPIPHAKEGQYEIVLTAEDVLGQAGKETKLTFIYDTAKPVLREVNGIGADQLRKGQKVHANSASLTLTGKIIEQNGIKSVKIGKKGDAQQTVSAALVSGSTDTYTFSKTFDSLADGNTVFTVEIEDLAGKTDTADITAVVDTAPPQFKKMKIGVHEFESTSNPNPFTGTDSKSTTRTPTVPISGEFEDKGQGVKELIAEWMEGSEQKREVFTAVPVEGEANWYKAEGAITLAHTHSVITFTIQDGSRKTTEWKTNIIRSNEKLSVDIKMINPSSAPYTQGGTPFVNGMFTLRLTSAYNGDEVQSLDLRINKDGTALSTDELNRLQVQISKGGSAFTDVQRSGNTISGFKSGFKEKETEDYDITITPRSGQADDGRYVFTFRSAAGDVQKQFSVWVDTKAPDLTPRVPISGQSLKEQPKLFAVIADTPGAGVKTVAVQLNGNDTVTLVRKGSSIESKHNLTLYEGSNTLLFTYSDYLGNADTKTITFDYDKTPPVISAVQLNGKTGDTVLIGTEPNGNMQSFTVEGKVKDTIGMKEVYAQLTNKDTGKEIGVYPKKVITGNTEQPFSWTVEHGVLTDISPNKKVDGLYTLSITAEDASGLTTSVVKNFMVDRAPPKVDLVTPAANSTVNKTITISGTASDSQKLKSVKVMKKGTPDTELASFTGDNAAAWSFTLDTTKYVPIAAGKSGIGSIVLKAIAEDEVGNKTEKEHTISINQHSDRPHITINSFAFIENSKANLVATRILTGKVEDDDGVVDLTKMKIGIGTAPAEPIVSTNGIWKYTIPDAVKDGSYDLHFTIQDKAGTLFTTAAAITDANGMSHTPTDFERPYVLGYEDSEGTAISKDIKFKLDTVQPAFKKDGAVTFVLAPDYTDTGSEVVKPNTILGNNAMRTASFKVLVQDASKIKKVVLKLSKHPEIYNGKRISSLDSDGFEAWVIKNVTLRQGEMPLLITATDNADFDRTWQETVIVDFTPPVAEVRPAILNAVYFLNADIVGTVKDTGSSGVSGVKEKSIQYKIGNSDWLSAKHTVSGVDLSTLKQHPGTWEITIPDVTKYKDQPGVVVPPPGSTTKTYTIPVQVKMQDNAGNEGISEKYMVQFDPAGSTPIVDLITPDANAVLGTSVVVSGLARTAKPGLTHYVKKIEVQLSKTDTFGTSWTIGGNDFGAGYPIIEVDSENNKINYWQYPLPDAVVNDILGGDKSKTLFIRVRGISSDGTTGAWTAARNFTISKDVAQFTPFTLGATANQADPPAYSPRSKWIKGDTYTLKGKVTHSSGIKKITAKTENAPVGVQLLDTTGQDSWYTPCTDGYEIAIPIKTSQYAQKSGEIEFTITAEDKRVDGQSIKSYSNIRLKYDNSNPSAAIGVPVGETAQTGFTAGTFTALQSLDPAKKAHYRVVVNNHRYEIDSITPAAAAGTGKTVKLKDATGLTGTFDYGITERPHIVHGESYQVQGFASDTGSGISKIGITLTVGSQSKVVTLTPTDNPKTITAERGDLVSFKGTFNTTEVPNGEGTLEIVVYDGAGNTISDKVAAVQVKNAPVKISKLTFKTNLDGNSSYNANTDEVLITELATNSLDGLNAEKDYRGTVDVSQTFTYKDNAKSELVVELDGGYKTARTLELYKDSVSPTNKISVPDPAVSGNTYTFNLADLLDDIGDGDTRKLILKVFDESIGKLWYAQADITVKVEHTDSTPPVGVIVPFFYNTDKQKLETEEDFKLTSVKYDSVKKEPLGHIEFDKITDLGNTHPSVSGTVILRGTAYDNVRIKELKLSGANIANASITNTDSGWQSGTKFTVKDKHNRKGHYVEWEYEWETGTPALAQTITLTVTDSKDLDNTGTPHKEPDVKTGTRGTEDRAITLASGDTVEPYQFIRLTDKKEQSYLVQVHSIEAGNKATWFNADVPSTIKTYVPYGYTANNAQITMNIVPYITKVETSLSKLGGNQPDIYARTALGHYPVQDQETINIHGFNLTGAKYTVEGVSAGTDPAGNTSPWSLKLAAGAKSGDLIAGVTVTSSGNPSTQQIIKAINNSNNNDKPYNKGAKTANNHSLTDDVTLDIWQFKSDAVKSKDSSVAYPVMKVHPDETNGKIGFAFANGTSWFSMASASTSYTVFQKNWDLYQNVGFTYGPDGTSYGIASGTDVNANNPSCSLVTFFEKDPNTGIGKAGGENYAGTGGIAFESIGLSGTNINKNRIQSPSIAAGKNVYIAYYDLLKKELRFRTKDKIVNIENTPQSSLSKPKDSKPENYQVVVNGKSTFVSLGVVSTFDTSGTVINDTAVVLAYYDAEVRRLKLRYKTVLDILSPWTENSSVNFLGGQDVQLAVDRSGGIHLAYTTSSGDLAYAYSSSYDGTFTEYIVDSYSLTGSRLTIDIAHDTNGRPIPYIGYFMQGAAVPKLAYLKDGSVLGAGAENDYYTGTWEVSVVPTPTGYDTYAAGNKVNVGVWKKKSDGKLTNSKNDGGSSGTDNGDVYGNGTANPVLGYVIESGTIETAQKK